MAKANFLSNGFLNLVFQGTTITGIAQNTTTSPVTSLYVSLHTLNPGAGGTQSTSEAAYTGYARVAVARTSGGWSTSSAQSVSPVAAITFPAATAGSETETFFSIGVATSGATSILYSGTVSPNIVVSNGVTPQLTTATTITES